MAEVTVQFEDGKRTFDTKKEMLMAVGGVILAGSEEPMTLRQLYYRFVALDLIQNKRSQYQYLSEAIKEARLEGIIPWDWIEDRTRSIDGGDWSYEEPDNQFERSLEWFKNTPERYHLPKWKGQSKYVEVWVEKEALAGIFASVCQDLRVVTFPSRGYTSITLLKDAAVRMADAHQDGKLPRVLYFGDFDPSGQDIERNIREKLNDTFGVPVQVKRIALTREQIDEHQLPPQPAKSTDARYDEFVEQHGNLAVELDALPPDELRRLIRESVEELFDEEHYQNQVLPEQSERRQHLRELVQEVLVDG